MNSNQRFCFGCMSIILKEQKTCPICGFEDATYNSNPRNLPLGALLHKRYIIGKTLGEGGFGITYIGWDTITEAPVAIKEYFPINAATRDCTGNGSHSIFFIDEKQSQTYKSGFEKYAKEAETLKQFNGLEGIVSIRDFFYENNTAYIVMEFIEGITLKEYIQTNGTLSPKETIELMMPVMLALEKIHEKGIVHRDISPDNIMIRIDGAFKLIDFGAARLTNDESGKNLTIILKRGYAPEEQYRSKGEQGPWTDIYALAATMYKMMTNHLPPESMERLVSDKIKPLSEYGMEISPSQNDAIMKGLSVKAKNRFQNMKDFRLALTNEKECAKDYHMIATFQEKDGTIVGYRLFDLNSNKIVDIAANKLIDQIQTGHLSVNNLIVYQRYVQTIGGSLDRYPVMNILEKLTENDNYYYVNHTLSKGYLCLDYRGVRCYFNEMDMQTLLNKNFISNIDKINLFISLREKKAAEFIPALAPEEKTVNLPKPISMTQELKNQKIEKEKPKHVKLSLKTTHSDYSLSTNSNRTSSNAGVQMRLRMANQTHLTNIASDKNKK